MPNNQIKSLTFDGTTYDIVDETSGYSTVSIDRKVSTGVNIFDITIDGTKIELYAPSGGGGSVESVGISNATNGGLSVSGSPITSSGTITIGHSNVLTSAQTTQAVYPIKIDKNGHISAYGNAVTIPTKVSDLTNDSGFITSYTETDPIFSASAAAGITSTDISNWNAKSDLDEKVKQTPLNGENTTKNLLLSYSLSTSGTTATTNQIYIATYMRYNDYTPELTLHNKSDNTKQLGIYSTSIGFKTGSYTATLSATTQTANHSISLPNKAGTVALTSDIPTVPTNVSAFTNDAGYLTSYTETDPVFTTSAAHGISSSDITNWNSKTSNTGTVTSVSTGNGLTGGPITTTGTISLNTAKYNPSSGLGGVQTWKSWESGATITPPSNTGTYTAPSVTVNDHTTTSNRYYAIETTIDGHMIVNVPWVTGITTETDPTVPSWAKASTKPSYTASEVGAAATSHAHGNITSGGDITATAPTIANGDQIIINDSSASKITNGPTFDGSTTNKYLSPKGTWENIPDSDDIVIVEYDVDTYSTAATAISNGKEVICKVPGDMLSLGTNAYGYLTLSTYDLEDEYIIFSTVEYWDDNEAALYTTYLTTATQPWGFNQIVLNESSSTGGYLYGNSSTAASTETKEISLTKELFDGVYSIITVYFDYGNTASALKLKINSYDTQGRTVYYHGAVTSSSNKLLWNDGDTLIFMLLPNGYAFISKVAPSSAASSTTGVSISNHSTSSVTGVQSSTTTASKVTLGTAISVPNVTAAGSGSFTQGSFSGGSLTFAIDSTDSKQLNITFTAATHGADSHTHTAPTLGTAISVPNVTAATDVTVPIKDTAATTVVTSATHTVTDNGHTHSLS